MYTFSVQCDNTLYETQYLVSWYFLLATFDLQNMTVRPNGIITCQYVPGSMAQGSLLVIIHQNDKFVYGIVYNENAVSTRIFELVGSDEATYKVMGYDLEQNGVLGTRAAVIRSNTSMMGILGQELGM